MYIIQSELDYVNDSSRYFIVLWASLDFVVPNFVATTWQFPADVDVSDSELINEQLAVPAALTVKDTVPVSVPPEVVNCKFVRKAPDSELKLSADWDARLIVKVPVSYVIE